MLKNRKIYVFLFLLLVNFVNIYAKTFNLKDIRNPNSQDFDINITNDFLIENDTKQLNNEIYLYSKEEYEKGDSITSLTYRKDFSNNSEYRLSNYDKLKFGYFKRRYISKIFFTMDLDITYEDGYYYNEIYDNQINFNSSIGTGIGRVYDVSEYKIAYDLIMKLEEESLLLREAKNNDIHELGDLLRDFSDINIFEMRKQIKYKLKTITKFLIDKELTKDEVEIAIIVNDVINIANKFSRKNGSQIYLNYDTNPISEDKEYRIMLKYEYYNPLKIDAQFDVILENRYINNLGNKSHYSNLNTKYTKYFSSEYYNYIKANGYLYKEKNSEAYTILFSLKFLGEYFFNEFISLRGVTHYKLYESNFNDNTSIYYNDFTQNYSQIILKYYIFWLVAKSN